METEAVDVNIEILNYRQKEAIKKGLEVLGRYFLEQEPDDLPEIAVFLETAARPFIYAVIPVLEKIYKEKGRKLPSIVFLKTRIDRKRFKIEQQLERDFGDDFKDQLSGQEYQEYVNLHRRTFFENYTDADIHYSYDIKIPRKEIQLRVKQIKQRLGNKDKPNILIFDEYATGSQVTLREADRAVRSMFTESNITNFVFVSGIRIDKKGNRLPELSPFDGKTKTIIGQTDPFLTPIAGLYSTSDTNYFDYYVRNIIFGNDKFPRVIDAKEKYIGVEKKRAGVRVSRFQNRDYAKMKAIRDEMRKIGEEVAGTIFPENKV